jgi:hypothetical protein
MKMICHAERSETSVGYGYCVDLESVVRNLILRRAQDDNK